MALIKRKHCTVTLKQKCKILDSLDDGNSVRRVADTFRVPKSTVSDIKKNKERIRKFVSRSYGDIGLRKVLKKAEHPETEEALYTWFLQQRKNHVPISSEILRTKAQFFYKELTGKTDFLASSGWLDKFKLRYGIRFLKVCGERVSSNAEAVAPFQEKLQRVIEEMQLSPEQLYNADESALFWRVLPNTTWVYNEETSAPGRKISKDRVTFMPCCNANGSHKLKLLVLGKAQNPRAFKNFDLPVVYRASSKGWMTKEIFVDWFKTCFIPQVKHFQRSANKPCKALLLIDNAPSHPLEDKISNDPNFRVLFLPPNCTALVQPMDQNLIQNIKVSYRKRLLTYIISQEDADIIKLLKNFSLKEAVIYLDLAWKSISEKNIIKSWSALWPQLCDDFEEEDISLAELRKRLLASVNDITDMLHTINPNTELTVEEISDWATGKNEFSGDNMADEEIIQGMRSKSSDEEPADSEAVDDSQKIRHSNVVKSFSICIQWAEENNIPYEKRESAQRDADRERRLRVDSETRAKQALQEAARCRSRLKLLTQEFARMEETVRAMLVYKKQAEQLRQEKAALTLAFENRCQQYQSTIARLNLEITTLRQQLEEAGPENNPEGILKAHTAALKRHAEESRKQYERCLDDVANQVVKALLAQKGLREEVGSLNNKIYELESQNRALTSMLVHQLRGESPGSPVDLDSFSRQLALECQEKGQEETLPEVSPSALLTTSLTTKHCNSFNSEILEASPASDNCDNVVVSSGDKRLSADSVSVLDTRFSLEDKKRHQVLNKLWTELKGTEVTPKRLLEALSAVDSALWVPPKRPVSLNLQLPVLQTTRIRKTRPVLTQTSSKSEEETTGNESPESGNRDEGYSTMSSDVQADVTRASNDATLPHRSLEDLKEASDETDLSADNRLLVTDIKDPDILYIPLNLLNLKQRNSFPPGKDILPFQHIMRSFSDSHLCIKITTAPSPCYSFTSPISSSPSIFLLDITEKTINPLRRTRGTNTLWGNSNSDLNEDKTSQLSWGSATEEKLECTTWDAEYIQHWLRLDETRSTLQQHRDMLELEYDRAELEDWSLSLSNDDLREQWKKLDAATPGQISISTLPSIQENNALELEEDSNECLWNNSSYMMDKEGRELVTLLMDSPNGEKQWPYAISSAVHQQISPDNSWSSGGSDCCNSHEPETCSKRSSAASDDTGELPQVGTDFTRDFYRLVKFESTKSLASTSSRSIGGALSENGDRDATLQNVLTFIAEQQKFAQSKDRPRSVNDVTKDFNIEGPPQRFEEIKITGSDYSISKSDSKSSDNENYVTLKQLCEEYEQKEKEKDKETEKFEKPTRNIITDKISYAEEVCVATALDIESENCSNINEHPVDICSSVNVELNSLDYQSEVLEACEPSDKITSADVTVDSDNLALNNSDLIKSTDTNISDTSANNCTSESLTSSVSTPDTVMSKIPRRRTPSRIPVSPARIIVNNNNKENLHDTKLPKSKIPHKSNKPKPKKIIQVQQNNSPQHVITSEKLPQSASGVLSNIIEGPPHRAISFHERATSKDVIEELNRMIKNGDENPAVETTETAQNSGLDQACRPTGWIHVEKDIDLTDPKARANLLDVMMASVSSDSSPTSSCGGSVASDSTEDPPDYGHLHRIHKYHRQKKAKAARPNLTPVAVVRASVLPPRPTIIGRPDFFVRYGDKEREAVASFDFLNELSSASSSLSCSIDESLEEEDEEQIAASPPALTSRVVKVSQV